MSCCCDIPCDEDFNTASSCELVAEATWEDPENGTRRDDDFVTCTESAAFGCGKLYFSDFKLTIPENAKLSQVIVRVYGTGSFRVQLTDGTEALSVQRTEAASGGVATITNLFGGPNFGDVVSTTAFGVWVEKSSTGDASVDSVQMAVCYDWCQPVSCCAGVEEGEGEEPTRNSPEAWAVSISGITDGACTGCTAWNGDWILTHDCLVFESGNPCKWSSPIVLGAGPCEPGCGNCSRWSVVMTSEVVALLADENGMAGYRSFSSAASRDCLGGFTLELVSGSLHCNDWPESVSITPIEEL